MSHSSLRLVVFFFVLSFVCLFFFRLAVGHPLTDKVSVLLVVSFLLANVLMFAVRSVYLKPLRSLITQLPRISQGMSPESAGLTREDEIGDLVRRIDEISQDFRETIAQAQREREEIRAVLSSMNEAVLVIDRHDRLMLMSAAVPKILELRSGGSIGRPYWEVIRHDEINSVIRSAMSRRVSISKDVVIYNPHEAFFNLQIAPVFRPDKEMVSLVVVMHDISGLKKYERMRSEFVANVSHELKTPLTSIRGYAETLRSGAIDDKEKAYRFVDIIDTQAKRLEALVSDVLSLSRVEAREADRSVLELDAEDVSQLIEGAISVQRNHIDDKRHIVEVVCPQELKVLVDRGEIEHVFLNLIDNAIKFTPEGGRIMIRVMEEGAFVRIDVEDSGIGIDKVHIDRLFERFYRIDASRSRELGGTGLGLAIVKHVVQAHNGKISVTSLPGKGSTFSVFLPVVRA
ncbi:MAG: PAS domain-containing protein [Candidatus Omnitrophica bacterium]|nr:PAS domain-containing protein [Candidatus Omnitrophota bacterium]